MNEILPGLWQWKAKHPRIGQDVGCHYFADAAVAFDPLVPPEGSGWFGEDGRGGVEKVVLSVRHHGRDAAEIAAHYGATIHAHEAGMHEFAGRDYEVQPFRAGDEIAPGVTVVEFGVICPDDAILEIHAGGGALLFGDGIVGYGGISFVPDHLMAPDDPAEIKAKSFDRLEQVLDEVGDFEALLFAHGDPIPTGGRRALEEFVATRR